MASIAKRTDGQWRARYRYAAGKEHARHFPRKVDAQAWLDGVTSSVVTGSYLDPKTARTTVGQWCDTWLEGYGTRRASTVRQAEVHVAKIREAFGGMRLSTVKPSHVRSWTAKLKAGGAADSYVYALHARLSQIMADAVHDGVIARNPCSRRTSPGAGKQRPYVATTEQVWALHDAVPDHLRPAVLLGAFAGLRTAEVCGLRVVDVDFMRGIVTPTVQYPAEPLKSDASRTPVPIPQALALELAEGAAERTWVVETPLGEQVGPWQVDRAVRAARVAVGMPTGFRFHDLRHYF
ncbi:MAG TPA: tyrosine-type recombinase/integrase, partial [Coriobacteriia bacterium]|nr:tyrosine-type recombinase/integrase [Coriobacteriia bacterium]